MSNDHVGAKVLRREFLKHALLGVGGALAASPLGALRRTVTLPMANGERPLVAYPQKRPLIVLTTRPPQLETPFAVFNEGVITPNDAFFVRYHLAGIPPSIDADTLPHRDRRQRVDKPLDAVAGRPEAAVRAGRDRRRQPVLGQQPRLLRAARHRRAARPTARWAMRAGSACR